MILWGAITKEYLGEVGMVLSELMDMPWMKLIKAVACLLLITEAPMKATVLIRNEAMHYLIL